MASGSAANSYSPVMTDFPTALPTPRTPDPATAPPLRWGIVAPGGIAGNFVEIALSHANQQVVAVGSRSAERAAAFGARFGIEHTYGSYDEVMADPQVQAVYVASPHSRHFEQALAAIAGGKHVLVEKAFTQNAAQAERLVGAAADAGVTLMEAMWPRFSPSTDVIRQLLADGVLGDIRTVIADHGQWFPSDPGNRLFDPDQAGGALLDLGIYPISFASFVLGAPDQITAVGTVGTSAGTEVDEQESVILRKGRAHALVHATLAALGPNTAIIAGSVARIEIPGRLYSPQPITVIHRNERDRLSFDGGPLQGSAGFAYEIAHFAQLVADGAAESALLPLAESVTIMRTLDEIRRQIGLRYPGE